MFRSSTCEIVEDEVFVILRYNYIRNKGVISLLKNKIMVY